MSTNYIVQQGDYLSKIARAFGFADYKTIWDAPENQKLKDLRKNPNILYPGDELVIPDKQTREESRPTDKKHKFEVQEDKLMLQIVLLGLDNKPMSDHDCTLIVETDNQDLTTKSDGALEEEIPPTVANGKLRDKGKPGSGPPTEREIPLKIGYLHPKDTVSGQVARLNNLGYNAGELPDHPLTNTEADTLGKSSQFLSAVEEFQCDFGLQVDGICGKNTQTKLVEIHGC